MAVANTHPPPAPPYQLQQVPTQDAPQLHSAQQRPRKSRTLSFRSDKSRGSQHKIDLHETSAEKEARRLHSKADPTLAMQEAEPSEVAATVKSSLASLRNIQHKDAFGNPIADPDRSNPTRSRWERPLDTIRSFEAAIDGGYSSHTEGATWGASRRASYYGGNGNGYRSGRDSYYGSRPPSMMYANRADGSLPDLRSAAMGQRDAYHDHHQQQQGQHPGYGSGYGPPPPNSRRGWPRMASEPPQFNNNSPSYRQPQNPNPNPQQDYPIPSNHRSYETVTTASGASGGSSAEPGGYQTDPTGSDNSSIERVQSVPRRQPEPVPVGGGVNDYGIGFGQGQGVAAYQTPGFTVGVLQQSGMNGGNGNNYQLSGGAPPNNYGSRNYGGGNPAPPAVPQKDLGGSGGGGSVLLRKQIATSHVQELKAAQPEKRKSWFARRFSKHG